MVRPAFAGRSIAMRPAQVPWIASSFCQVSKPDLNVLVTPVVQTSRHAMRMPARAAKSTDEGVDVEKVVQDLQARVRGRPGAGCVEATQVHILHHHCICCAISMLLP